MEKRFKVDAHTHTTASGHAYSTITENAAFASKTGIELLCMTDHAPNMPGGACRLHFVNQHVIPDVIMGVKILKGAELNIMDHDGTVDLPDSIIKKMDVVIASMHLPCIEPDADGDFTDAIINSMKNPYVNIIGHPGDRRYPFDISAVVSASKRFNVALEVNNTSFSPKNSRSGGDDIIKDMLRECKSNNVPVVLGSDAHYSTYIGVFDDCVRILESVDFPYELILNRDVRIFEDFLEKKRKMRTER